MIYEGAGSIFFNDQYVNFVHEDLNNIEYTKLKTIRDSLAACIKQPGVAISSLVDSSLKVNYVDSKHFTVNPGTAIDKFGRLIYVPTNVSQYGNVIDDPEYHPKWPDRENLPHGKVPNAPTRYYVNIYYNTQQDIVELDDAGGLHYIRDYGSYYIACENFQAGASSSFGSGSLGICLGSFEVDTSGNIRFGQITDLRLILCNRLEPTVYHNFASGSRRIFALYSNADSIFNSSAENTLWYDYSNYLPPVLNGSLKAKIGYVHRTNTNNMNIRFCGKKTIANSAIYIYIYDYTNTLIISQGIGINYNYRKIYNASLDLSGLLVDNVYYILIKLIVPLSLPSGYCEIKDFIIDVN